MTETVEGNAGNGADQPRRARSSTERSRAHRARKKLEREGASQKADAEREAALKAETERVAEAVAAVAAAVAPENAVAGAAPRPTEPKVEREAAALHEAAEAECETAMIDAVAGRVADVAEAVASENAVSSPPAIDVAGVPAVSTFVVCRTVERPVWRPAWRPIMVSLDAHPPAHPDAQRAHPAHLALRRALGSITPSSATIAYLVAYGLFVVGLTINVTLAISYAPQSSWWHATIMALEGVAIEVLAFRSPSWGCELWRGGSKVASAAAWGIWPVMIVMSLMAATGFSASTIGDVLAKRSAAMTTAATAATRASNIADDIKKLREKHDAITETRSPEVIKLQIVRERFKVDRIDRDAFAVTVGCTRLTHDVTKACNAIAPTLQALAAAHDRDKLAKEIKDAEDKQERKTQGEEQGAPIIGSVDPGAESFSKILGWISWGWITPSPDNVAVLRLLGLTIVPSLAGLVLMFAQLLAAPRTGPQSRAPHRAPASTRTP
jgi:hypothetical protein